MRSASASEIHPRRLDDAVGYYFGELSPGERSRFEKHLHDCAACTRAVATAGVLFPAVQELLAVPPPRLTTDELLSRMELERRRIEAQKRAPAKSPRPVKVLRRWMYALGPVLATTVLVVWRVSLFTGPGFLLASPRRPRVARPSPEVATAARVDLYVAEAESAIRPLKTGAVLEVGADGKVHLWVKGDARDRDVLLVAQDPLGRLTPLWPGGDDRRGAACPGGCEHLELAVDARSLPPGATRAVLWLGPGPLDASGLRSLRPGEPPSLPGARASTWFDLYR